MITSGSNLLRQHMADGKQVQMTVGKVPKEGTNLIQIPSLYLYFYLSLSSENYIIKWWVKII